VLPATIGPYAVMRPLGGGGMGEVSLCRSAAGRLVAVKQVREEYADDPAFRSRFRREVAAARRVSGVYTVPVLDADPDAARPWVATAYVPGPTLDQALRVCGSFQEPALRALGTALAEALQVVHAAGVVHRDLKPGNVLLAADGPRLIDFGISKALDETRITGTGTVIGSAAFMAPEQITSLHDVGPAGDVFALAAVLVYAGCGEGPFGTGEEVLHRVVTAEPDLSGVPGALHPLLLRCLDKTPSRRPTAEQVLEALAPADPADLLVPALREDLAARARDAELMAVAPPPPGRGPGGPDGRRRAVSRRAALVGGLVAAGALAGGAAVLALRGHGGTSGASGTPGTGGGTPLGSTARTLRLTAPPLPSWTARAGSSSVAPDLRAYGDVVVLHDAGYAAAYDIATGRTRWEHGTRPDGQLVSGDDPLGAQSVVLGLTDANVVFYRSVVDRAFSMRYAVEDVDPATARPRAAATLPSLATLPSAVLADHGDRAYFLVGSVRLGAATPTSGATAGAGFSAGDYIAAIDMGPAKGGGTIRWQKPVVPNSISSLRYAADRRGFYYTEDSDSGLVVHALDADSGKERWSVRVPADPDSHLPAYMQAGGGELTSNLVAAGDLLVTVGLKGGMTAYDALTGKRRWAVAMTAAADLTVVGGTVLTHDNSHVTAVELSTGTVKWQVESPIQFSGFSLQGHTMSASEQVTAVLFSPLSVGRQGVSLTGGTAGCLALRTSDGQQLWALRQKPGATGTGEGATGTGEGATGGSGTASPAPSIGGGTAQAAFDQWSVAVSGTTVVVSGAGQVAAYRAGLK
jgi:outer membrane protein assembly factor BamB